MEATLDKRKDSELLSGDLNSLVWKLSLPSIAAMVLFGLNTVSDAFFIGQLLGKTAIAGVALANPFIAIVLGAGYWIGTGAGNQLSICIGANDTKQQGKFLGTVAIQSLVLGGFVFLGLYTFSDKLIALTGGSGTVLQFGVDYLSTVLFAAPIWIYALSLNMLIRAEGNMKQSAWMIFRALLVNIVLTPLFIKGFDMGVEGAAWATNAGMLVLLMDGYFYFLKNKSSFESNATSFRYDAGTAKKILVSGLPAFIFNLMALIQAVVVFYVVNDLGSDRDIAFYAATNVLYLFLMTPLYGLMRAYQPLAGINFGAGELSRVKTGFIAFLRSGYVLILPFFILLLLFPSWVLHALVPELVISKDDLLHFRVYLISLPVLPLVFMALTLFPSVNKSSLASIIVLGRQLILYLPVMLVLPRWMGIPGIYYGSTLVNLLIAMLTLVMVRNVFDGFQHKNND
jgi:Na+-driven multidrug efflux pump